ncbi:hypothetical protein MMC16_001493 [Acarospora aff. strigata]|nr:hypothetical protein [Acarospora aff. strigata]
MESWEQGRGASPAPSHRKMSFNPVGTWVPPVAHKDPVRAYEISKVKRILQVAVAVIYCLLSAGIVFGYAALKPVLVKEGVYKDRCREEGVHPQSDGGLRTCYEQEIRLNLMFTVAAVATNVCALPVGTILDRYGPRTSGIVGSILLATGALFLSFAALLPFDGYIPGYLFLALGGPFVFISSFQLSNTFPNHSGLILALLTGAFDSSSAVFLIYRLLYTASGSSFTPQKFFLVYLVVPAFVLIVEVFLMPAKSYKTVGELVAEVEIDNEDSETHAIASQNTIDRGREARQLRRQSVISELTGLLASKGGEQEAQQDEEEKKKRRSGVWGVLHGRTALEQIKSPWFVLITLFTIVQMTRINYFVATIRPQYEYLLKDYEKAEHVNNIFDVALPLGGVFSVPFIGLVLDKTSTPFVLALLVTVATTIGILGVLPYLWAAYANIALFVIYRPLYYTAVSDYAAKVFGFQTFGKVYGLIICLAGLFNFSQSALDALTHKLFHRDPVPVNVLLLSTALVVGLALVGFVSWRSRGLKREVLEDEAEGAREVRIPTAAAGAGDGM